MSRNVNNRPGVFLTRSILIRHENDQVKARGGVVWEGNETLTGEVPSALGRILDCPYLGYGQAMGAEDLESIGYTMAASGRKAGAQ